MNDNIETQEQEEPRPQRNTTQWLGQVMYLAGILGIILILLMMIALPLVANQVGRNLKASLIDLADGLGELSNTVVLANDSITNAADALTNTATTLDDVNTSLEEVVPLLETVGTIAGETAPATIESTYEALLAAESGAKAIDGVMRALSTVSFITGIHYNPTLPLDDALVQTAANLEPLPDELRQIQDELGGFTTTVEQIQPSLTLTASSLRDLGESLSDIQTEIDDQALSFNANVKHLRKAAEGISTWVWGLVIFLEVILLWAIFGQVTVIYVGRELRDKS